MALENYSAEEQQFITLFAAVLNKAPTPDLIAEASTYLEAGLSQGDLLQVLFDLPVVPYAGYKDGATTNAFLTSLISNLAAGSGIAPAVQAQWVAALASDYAVYSEAGYSKGEFAAALVELLQTWDLPAGSDLAKLAGNIEDKAVAAAAAYEPTDTFTNWDALETPDVDPQPNPGDTVMIGMGDNAGEYVYAGGTGDDMFRAVILDNQNTFVSGLTIDGGAGYDSLYAEIGNSQNFSITPWLTDVEKVQIRVQAVQNDQADNNTGGAQLLDTAAQLIETLIKAGFGGGAFAGVGPEGPLVPVTEIDQIELILSAYLLANFRGTQVDAQETSGVLHWESKNSRSDLLIEDVRILDNQITKDITIAFVDSDPGNVDFAVYIDQQSLRKAGSTTEGATLVLEILDTRAALAGEDPLRDNPFDGFGIKLNGVDIVVRSPAIDAAQTYPELLEAIKAAVAADPRLADIEVTLGNQFTAVDTESGIPVTGTQIVLTNTGEGTVQGLGWTTATGVVPPSTGLHLVQENTLPNVEDALITSTIILDNVGRGSTGGDLVIGGLSVGDTSASKGVEQFDITVYQSSKLQTIASTNNTLEVVNLMNDGNTYTDWVDGLPVVRYGNLTVLGSIDSLGSAVFDFDKFGNAHKFTNLVTAGDLPLPGHAVEELLGFGFTDVREINAADFGGSAFKGNIDVSLILTDRVVEKYLDRTDTQDDAGADNVEFSYAFGDGNDRFAIAIDDENLVRAGTTTHEDFELTIDGGNGNDVIKAVIGYTDGSNPDNWYLNSQLNANLAIMGGAGDDEVHTIASGDWIVDLGAGNDTYYADNTGGKNIWVRNEVTASSSPTNILSQPNEKFAGLYKSTLTVTLTTDAVLESDSDVDSYTSLAVEIPSTGFGSSDLQINQAIKEAINSDPVLSKLLVAEDGPANTLIVSSLIDGSAKTLTYDITAPTAASLTTADVSGYANANGLVGATAASVAAAIAAAVAAAEASTDDGFTDYFGSSNSSQVADNVVTGGTGNDVLVLGTGAFSNDTVKYVGLGNGYDTIVNFDVNTVAGNTGTGGSPEVVTLTFSDSDGSPAAQTIVFQGQTIVLSNPSGQGVVPAEDVAYQFNEQFNSANWVASHAPNSNTVVLTAVNVGNVATNVAAGDFTGTYITAGSGVVTPVTVDGVDSTVAGSTSTFTVTFDETQTAASAAGAFTFDGQTINYALGDGGVTLANLIAGGAYPNWAVSGVSYVGNEVSVTFTANAVGTTAIGTVADFDLAGVGITGSIEGTVGTATGAGVPTVTPGDGFDYLDFSTYAGVDHVVVNGSTLVGGALPTASDSWVSLTENTAANPGAGVYTIELHTLDAAGAATVGLIGVADFGSHKDFIADNFIV